jgi:hypothetical protein
MGSPYDTMIANLEGGPFYLTSQVSEITGIPAETLRTWRVRKQMQAPSKFIVVGEIKVYLYTEEDLVEIRNRRSGKVQENRK